MRSYLRTSSWFFDERVVRCDDGHGNGYEREPTVFEFACGVGFGVDVADFFQLQCAFECDGRVQAATLGNREQFRRQHLSRICRCFWSS